jgi:hypothetical protein
VAFPIGTAVTFVNQNGAGVITIAITSDTLRLAGAGTTGSRSLAANGIATAVKVTSTEWIISGTVGDLVYVVCEEQTNNTWGTCSDNLGNTYNAVSAGTDLSAIACRQYWSIVTNAGTLTTISVTATASADNCIIIASVIEGVFAAASALDANPSPVTDDITDPMTGPATGTLSQADEVIMCFCATNGNPTVTADAPFTQDLEVNSGTTLNLAVAHLLVSATTTVTPTFDLSGSPTTSILGTASFKKA